MKLGGKDIYNTFFIPLEDKKHKCKSCNGTCTQDIKKGYTNLVTHIQKEHPGWENILIYYDIMDTFIPDTPYALQALRKKKKGLHKQIY